MSQKNINKQNVGERIKSIRLTLGDDLEKFGNKLSTPAAASLVSRWERGVNLPNAARVKEIAALGNVRVNYLLYGLTPAERNLMDRTHGPVQNENEIEMRSMLNAYNDSISNQYQFIKKTILNKPENLSERFIELLANTIKLANNSNMNSEYLTALIGTTGRLNAALNGELSADEIKNDIKETTILINAMYNLNEVDYENYKDPKHDK